MIVRLPKFIEPFEVENVVVSVPVFKVHFGDLNVKPGTFSVKSATGDISVNVGFHPYLSCNEILIIASLYL